MLIVCDSCEALVDAEPVGHFDASPNDDPWDTQRFTFLRCPRCSRPILAAQDMVPTMNTEVEWSEPTRLYPAPDRKADHRLPTPLRDSFEEALGALRAKLYNAAALMCRKTLEGICHLKGGQSGNLGRALKELHEKGVIDDRLFEWAEALREDGNLAAHDLENRVLREDAAHIVDFTEAILEYVFVLSNKFQEYQALRAKRAAVKADVKKERGTT